MSRMSPRRLSRSYLADSSGRRTVSKWRRLRFLDVCFSFPPHFRELVKRPRNFVSFVAHTAKTSRYMLNGTLTTTGSLPSSTQYHPSVSGGSLDQRKGNPSFNADLRASVVACSVLSFHRATSIPSLMCSSAIRLILSVRPRVMQGCYVLLSLIFRPQYGQ